MTPKTKVDSGWAWVVLAATAGSMFLNGILVYFVGVVHAGLLRKYQESIAATAWVGGLYTSLMMLGAPVGSYLIGRIGCRKTSVIGGLFLAIGLSSSAFVTSIGQLFITYGCIAGMGLALTYTPAVLTIGFYFDKLRGLASGLSASAAALGILSGSLIMQILIDQFSVSGAFLIMGALTLHHCFFGMFYRPTVFEGGHDSWVEKGEETVIHSAECVPESKHKTAASAPLLSSVDFEREEPESEKRTSNPLEKIIQREAPDSEKINERIHFARSRESFDREETLYRKELVLTTDVELHAVATAQIQSSPRNKISSLQEIDGGREPSFSQSSTVFFGQKTGEYMSKELTVNSDRAVISEDEASPAVTGNASLISDNSESSVIGEEKPLLNPQNCLVIEHGVTPNGTQSENYRETEKITQLENMIDEATSNVKDKSSSNRIGKSTSKVRDKSTSNVTDKSTSNVTDKSTSNVTDKSTSNVTDKSTSNVRDKSTSNVTDKSTSNVTDKSTSNVTDKSTSNVTDKSTSNVTDTSTSNVTDKSTSNVTDTSTSNVTDKSTSNVTDKSTSNVTDKSTSNVTDKSTSNVTDKSTSNVTDKSTSNVTDKSTSKVTDKSASKVTDKSTSNVTDKSTSNVTDTSTSNVTDKSTSNVTDKSTSKVTDKSASKVTDKSTSNVTDKSTSNVTDTSTSNVTDKSTSNVTDKSTSKVRDKSTRMVRDTSTSNVTDKSTSNVTDTSTSNVTDKSTSNVRDKSTSNVTDKSTSNVTDKSTSNVTDKSTSNVTDKSTSNVTDKSTSNVTDKSTSNVTDKSTSNVTDKSTSNVTDKSTSKVRDKSTSNVTDKSTRMVRDTSTSNVTDKSTSNLIYKSTSNNNSSSKCGATLSVLKNSGFFCYALSQLALCVTSSGVFLHLPEYVQHHGTSPTAAAALFVAVGVSSMCARLATGFMTTDERIDPLMIQMGITGLCGLVTVLFPLYSDSYGGQVAFSAMFGFYTGGSVSLYSVVIVRFVGVRLLTAAFGILLFSMGVGNIAGPPVAAVVVDLGGTYEQSFVFLGLVMEVSFLLHLAAGYFLKPRSDAESKEVEVVHGDFMGSAVVISAAPSSLHVSSELA